MVLALVSGSRQFLCGLLLRCREFWGGGRADHIVDYASGFRYGLALEAYPCLALYQVGGCDVLVFVVVEFNAVDLWNFIWDRV